MATQTSLYLLPKYLLAIAAQRGTTVVLKICSILDLSGELLFLFISGSSNSLYQLIGITAGRIPILIQWETLERSAVLMIIELDIEMIYTFKGYTMTSSPYT